MRWYQDNPDEQPQPTFDWKWQAKKSAKQNAKSETKQPKAA
jgi:hypothetical protein